MSAMLPAARPRQSREVTASLVPPTLVEYRVVLVGIRGYYRDTMGVWGVNDRGLYDDAIFVLTPDAHVAFNASVDPSRWGRNSKIGKPYALLRPGVWRYRLGMHKRGRPGAHPALVQADAVSVARVMSPNEPSPLVETGWFGINIHRGGNSTTSSEGCQTLPPDQWSAFYALVKSELSRHAQSTLPYVLRDGGAA